MDPLLFADHLRSLRKSAENRPERGPGIDLAGAGALLAAACVICLLVVTLRAAFPQPLSPFGEGADARLAYDMKEERK